jgi:hypothetical protein
MVGVAGRLGKIPPTPMLRPIGVGIDIEEFTLIGY